MSQTALETSHRGGAWSWPMRLIGGFDRLAAAIPASLPKLLLRVAVAIPFLNSGLLKWDGFLRLSDVAVLLFENEFVLHLFGSTYPFPMPATAALLAALGEVILPVLLILGVGTRFAALGLLVMTGVIQLTMPDGWAQFHLPWAAMLFAILVWGPGRLSADHALSYLARR